MNNLHGFVLEYFLKDIHELEINSVCYGEKALDKFIEISFKDRSEEDKEIYKKQWDTSKVNNSVYFIYKKDNHANNKINHRFISDSWLDGGHSYLGHISTTE
jgi:hypothetical protein